ncbi:MAG: hypothetical protein RR100_15045, partial [Comamonas sp.]
MEILVQAAAKAGNASFADGVDGESLVLHRLGAFCEYVQNWGLLTDCLACGLNAPIFERQQKRLPSGSLFDERAAARAAAALHALAVFAGAGVDF